MLYSEVLLYITHTTQTLRRPGAEGLRGDVVSDDPEPTDLFGFLATSGCGWREGGGSEGVRE